MKKPQPIVAPHDEIRLGSEIAPMTEVICSVKDDAIRAVYITRHGKAVAEVVKWDGERWHLASSFGAYADRDPSLAVFVSQARGHSR